MAIINNFLRDENGLEPSEYAIDVWLIAFAVIVAGCALGALIIGAINNLYGVEVYPK
ncbi:MAG TPA: Flp family type IVb pilin [Blastocatellia bacterium]|nr:Flp family type IVb pilin [Blastocatellia bacterium]